LSITHTSTTEPALNLGAATNREILAFLSTVPPVDEVGASERVALFKSRSIKADAKMAALLLAVQMMDLTTLQGDDTPGKVRQMAAKGIRPDPSDPTVPPVAALCVYPSLVPTAVEAVANTSIKVASVATYFPSGQVPLDGKITEVENVVAAGADEVDMVINRGAFLRGDYRAMCEEIVAIKKACGPAHLKVILETGELGNLDNVRRASVLSIACGADFIKTSTGKISEAATLPVTLVMLETIREHFANTGQHIGMKPAGGIRSAKEAISYLVMINETLGPQWLSPDLFRFGVSSLLNDVLMQIRYLKTGHYQGADYFTKD